MCVYVFLIIIWSCTIIDPWANIILITLAALCFFPRAQNWQLLWQWVTLMTIRHQLVIGYLILWFVGHPRSPTVSRCMFTCPCWMMIGICMPLLPIFTNDTIRYYFHVISLSPHAHKFVYLTLLDFWHQFCTRRCMTLYNSCTVSKIQAGCKQYPLHSFLLSGNPGMKGMVLL